MTAPGRSCSAPRPILSLNAPNALVQESVRAFYRTWYRDLVTALPEVKDGMITVPPGPGLGMELHPDLDRAFTDVAQDIRRNHGLKGPQHRFKGGA